MTYRHHATCLQTVLDGGGDLYSEGACRDRLLGVLGRDPRL